MRVFRWDGVDMGRLLTRQTWILGHQFACVKWRISSFSKPSNQSFSLNKRPEVQKKETPGKRKERDSWGKTGSFSKTAKPENHLTSFRFSKCPTSQVISFPVSRWWMLIHDLHHGSNTIALDQEIDSERQCGKQSPGNFGASNKSLHEQLNTQSRLKRVRN